MNDLDHLRTFVAAARLGSFAAAGRQLNVSPAMVGRRIQGLEAQYQLKLIERTTRSQRLIEQGGTFSDGQRRYSRRPMRCPTCLRPPTQAMRPPRT